MKALLPELEEYLSTIEVPKGTDTVCMEIHGPAEEIIKTSIVMRKYAYITQTTLNIIGIRVTITGPEEPVVLTRKEFKADRQVYNIFNRNYADYLAEQYADEDNEDDEKECNHQWQTIGSMDHPGRLCTKCGTVERI